MDEYNANIIYKCFSNQLNYVYGLQAIKRELKLRDKLKKCKVCKRKYLHDKLRSFPKIYDPNCEHIGNNNVKLNFSYCKRMTNKKIPSNNYFAILPDEIISLIINNLFEYEIMNFYIATENSDRTNFIKMIYWAQIGCAICFTIKKKYYHCFICDLMICSDCTKKCEYCDNRIINRCNKSISSDIDNSPYYLKNFHNICDYGETCLGEWSICNSPERNAELYQDEIIRNDEYSWSINCKKCGKLLCNNCIGYDLGYGFNCKRCHIN